MALYRVLIAISNSELDVGYVQGLNSVVGTLLLYLKEEDAYWMTIYFLRKKKLNQLFSPPFLKNALWNYQLDILVQNYLPDVHEHIVLNILRTIFMELTFILDEKWRDS